jgi:hypothetical protein
MTMSAAKWTSDRAARIAVAVASFVYAVSALLAVPGYMASGDSLYHFDVSRKIWAGDLTPDPSRSFPWTIYADWPVDHYWGFHLMNAPFAAFNDSEIGMKVAAATLFALFLVVLHGVMRRRKVPFAWAWALASVMISSQDWRYLQLRGGVVMAALALVFAEVAFFVDDKRRRRIALVVIAWVSLLSYNGALALVPVHVAGIVALVVLERDRTRMFEPLLTGIGLVLGLLANPYMDRKASTFRFLVFHVRNMGRDPERIFAGRENVEFNPFPLHALWDEWIWSVLLVIVAAAVFVLVRKRRRKEKLERDEIVYGALTLTFIVLTARTLRVREYAVPIGFTFLATVARPWMQRKLAGRSAQTMFRFTAAVVLGMILLAARQWSRSVERIPRVHPPLDMFEGARPILEAHAGAPVANLVQGDSSMLLWEWGGVQVTHALSPYFVYYKDRALYDDLKTLRESPDDDAQRAALLRLRGRGCRLVSSRDDLTFNAFAFRHPELVHIVFAKGARLYEIEP